MTIGSAGLFRDDADEEDLEAPADGAADDQEIAGGEGVEAAAVEVVEPDNGEGDADVEDRVRRGAVDQVAEERGEDDVEAGEEAGVGDGGRLKADLLEQRADDEGGDDDARSSHHWRGVSGDALALRRVHSPSASGRMQRPPRR